MLPAGVLQSQPSSTGVAPRALYSQSWSSHRLYETGRDLRQSQNLHLPRILCLHGGGTNARIFHAQCRVLRAHMGASFRLVFADAPFPSPAGPEVDLVYADSTWGRFRSWLPPDYEPGEVPSEATVRRIDDCILAAMQADDKVVATGQWVGLLGFSQGAKMAASILLRQQIVNSTLNRDMPDRWRATAKGPEWRFAILLAGRSPLLPLHLGVDKVTFDMDVLRVPTVHVHGLRDKGIDMHRELLEMCCDRRTSSLVEWDGDHRVPIKSRDVVVIVAEVLRVAYEVGVLF